MTDAHGNVTVYNYANLELTSVIQGLAPASLPPRANYVRSLYSWKCHITGPDGNVTDHSYAANGPSASIHNSARSGTRRSYTIRRSLDDLGYFGCRRLDETTSYIYESEWHLTSVTIQPEH